MRPRKDAATGDGRPSRPPARRRTIRMRLTLLYGGLFLVSGVFLLALTYALVRHAVTGPPVQMTGLISRHEDVTAPSLTRSPPQLTADAGHSLQLRDAVERERAQVMHELLISSGAALTITSVIAVLLGWIVAGRILRRLRAITSAARDISATSLHRRLALEGPKDELTELGDTFDSLLGRLQAAFQAQRMFIANASHELRTPLARQRVISQVVLSNPHATRNSLRTAHERILAAGAQQERLIEALLTLARGDAGIEIHHRFDLAQLAHEVIKSRRAEAERKPVTIRPRLRPALTLGHQPLAEQLVSNLVDNALRHNMPDGLLEITTDTVAGRPLLTVANTGPTILPDDIELLFQPFRQLGTARIRRAGDEEGAGLGLGLSIVQAVARAHNATVTATARDGGGLTVTVAFPPWTSP